LQKCSFVVILRVPLEEIQTGNVFWERKMNDTVAESIMDNTPQGGIARADSVLAIAAVPQTIIRAQMRMWQQSTDAWLRACGLSQ